jgi:hypothetical protein
MFLSIPSGRQRASLGAEDVREMDDVDKPELRTVRRVCAACGELLAVHEHASYQEVKDCLAGIKPLWPMCASWPGCPLPQERKQGQEVER